MSDLGNLIDWKARAEAAEAALAEAARQNQRYKDELARLRKWALVQNAGNAFAEQVAYWATARLAGDAE